MNDNQRNQLGLDYYEADLRQQSTPLDAIWYVIKSILSGLGFIAVAFLLGYWSVK